MCVRVVVCLFSCSCVCLVARWVDGSCVCVSGCLIVCACVIVLRLFV